MAVTTHTKVRRCLRVNRKEFRVMPHDASLEGHGAFISVLLSFLEVEFWWPL